MANNTLFIARPTQDALNAAKCSTSCGNLGVSDPLDVRLLGPRKNRDRVREQIKDYVLLMLGAPTITIELDQQQLDAAVDLSLQIIEDYAPAEYFQWYTFTATPGQSVYTLPPDVGYVREIAYRETPRQAFTASDIGGVIPLEYMGAGAYGSIAGGINPQYPVWGKMNEWVLYKQYEDMYSRISGQQGGWEWIGGFQTIKVYPTPYRAETIMVRYIEKNKDWPRVTQSMQEGALAFAKIMVGRIRTKIGNPPGPNGGIQLDGQAILQEGIDDKEKWEERLLTRFGDILPIRMG
jgi:hypothetical protein